MHEVGGMLKGLEYKLKSESSLFRKIMSDLDEEKAKDDGGLDVRKPPFFGFRFWGGGAFCTKNDQFSKTGSGQT